MVGRPILITPGGKIRDLVIGHHVIDRLGDEPILKKRFGEINDIVNNDFAPNISQVFDTLGKTCNSLKNSMKGKCCPWGYIVDDLGHSPAFVGAAATQFGQNLQSGG